MLKLLSEQFDTFAPVLFTSGSVSAIVSYKQRLRVVYGAVMKLFSDNATAACGVMKDGQNIYEFKIII